jgi:hypothetical protein
MSRIGFEAVGEARNQFEHTISAAFEKAGVIFFLTAIGRPLVLMVKTRGTTRVWMDSSRRREMQGKN